LKLVLALHDEVIAVEFAAYLRGFETVRPRSAANARTMFAAYLRGFETCHDRDPDHYMVECSQPTYEDLKQLEVASHNVVAVEFAAYLRGFETIPGNEDQMGRPSSQPTYEDLKPKRTRSCAGCGVSSQPTYEDLKPSLNPTVKVDADVASALTGFQRVE